MKLRTFSATLALTTALGLGLSTPTRAQAPEPCAVFLCMASMSGYGSPSPGCTAPITVFHSIQIWSPKFNSSATASARRSYLMSCQGATGPNQAVLESIIAQWGYAP
ncbi:hypothetical protein [Variovorax sp. ZT4R33]|uniref:hypothetical protein n=1 Tax=Variovorax sp. ZT4R33 TaxID=3443743 RepID=UPI003F44A0E0